MIITKMKKKIIKMEHILIMKVKIIKIITKIIITIIIIQKNNTNLSQINNKRRKYINESLYYKFKNEENINDKDVDEINVKIDGNCYMRCIALFVYLDENEHYRVRNKISNYLYTNYKNYET